MDDRKACAAKAGSYKSVDEVKTCEFLRNDNLASPRLIVAGCYLPNGHVAFIDRSNCQLLLADVVEETYDEMDLKPPVRNQASQDIGSPSDVNRGFAQNELLLTFTHKDTSTVMLYDVSENMRLSVISKINVPSRTRSAVVLDDGHIAVTSSENVYVIRRDGMTLDSKGRRTRDRGGLMMADRRDGRFFYGDGDDYVGCQWKEGAIHELFRFRSPWMKLPRGSALDKSGRVLVCCDSSRNIFHLDSNGRSGNIVLKGTDKAYGDVDVFEDRREFFTTFWGENEWPMIFRLFNA